jgi:hypothetical protein
MNSTWLQIFDWSCSFRIKLILHENVNPASVAHEEPEY